MQAYFGDLKDIREKPSEGLVSEADIQSEEVIFSHLQKSFPQIGFLGEEKGETSVSEDKWIVDPLDGTTNYIYKFPIFAISIGLEIKGELVLGVVDIPFLNQTYWAVKGEGAYLGDQKLQVSSRKNLAETLLGFEFSAQRLKDPSLENKIFEVFRGRCHGFRRIGCSVYDLCLVAEGVFDGFWAKPLRPWDMAAGVVLVREAGGVLSNFQDLNMDIYQNDILASTPFFHPGFFEATKKVTKNYLF